MPQAFFRPFPNKFFALIGHFLFCMLALGLTEMIGIQALPKLPSAFGEPLKISDRQALLELQKLVAKKPPYSPDSAKQIHDLIFQIWDKPGFRHQTATLINMNNGYIDEIFNRSFLESLPPGEKDIPNFGRVDKKLFRGGQPTEEGYLRLKKLGVRTVVNLRAENGSEEHLVKKMGMKYHWIPIPDTYPPTDAQIDEFISLLRARNSGKVFVHCAAGRSRTGTMVAIWRMENGMKLEQAYAEAVKFHFNDKHLAADRQSSLIRSYKKRR